jgi:hypothetical protein
MVKADSADGSLLRALAWILGVPVFTLAAAFLFWISGGINWLDTKVFPPRRPAFMPVNSVWIDAPSLPISWHHGWWFGCGLSPSGTANYCRLILANGELVYGGEYLLCTNHSPMDEASIRLVPPPHGEDMWLFREGIMGPIGFLESGDLLVPVSVQDKCERIKARFLPHRSSAER